MGMKREAFAQPDVVSQAMSPDSDVTMMVRLITCLIF